MSKVSLEPAISTLREVWEQRLGGNAQNEEFRGILSARDEVLARFGPVFDSKNIPQLTEEGFREFLPFKNNRHWLSLQRKGPQICSDMSRLRQALQILVDESRPIDERLNQLLPAKGPAYVPHLGKAILTPILLVHDPEKYGVWNSLSEAAMRKLDLWPDMDRAWPFGRRYEQVNSVILRVAEVLGVDLWTLDSLWWRAVVGKGEEVASPLVIESAVVPIPAELEQTREVRFGLERHLHEFLRDNWSQTELGADWKLHEEDGDSDAGYEYPTDIGRIDLLARHRKEPRWLVIELKRGQGSDQTVGQVLRYMGWVKHKLASKGEEVEGLIIAHSDDEAVRYALSATNGIKLRLYEVQFQLRAESSFPTG